MTIIDQTRYPHAVTFRFESSEDGKRCCPQLTRLFKSYQGQSHREFDYRRVDFYLQTLTEKTRFEVQAKDITQRLLDNHPPLRLATS